MNKIVNAVVDERFDEALKDAQKADILCNELSEKELEEKFPLLGVPFSAKEVVGVKGKAILNFIFITIFKANILY